MSETTGAMRDARCDALRRLRDLTAVSVVVALALVIAACGSAGTAAAPAGTLRVVAAENFWGSIAAQLGGSKVAVTSIITSPNTDPHSYEPTAADARTMAGAQMVVLDGIGYDPWATQLMAANPVGGRVVLTSARSCACPWAATLTSGTRRQACTL